MSFSAKERNNYVQQLKNNTFDIVVIGGGITGAGIALDAVNRGLKVALVEKCDFAFGTSSRSTKLIHGGLRYLKQFEIGLVREVGRERAILHKNAPHIVLPEKMLLPIVENGSLGKYSTSLGLYVYDRLAGVKSKERRKMLSAQQTYKMEELLNKDILKGGGLYIEYRTDDARLTIEVMKTAVSKGAVCLNYTEVIDVIKEQDKICGIVVSDAISGERYTIKGTKIINAAGPWVDIIRKTDGKVEGKHLQLTKGVHIVVSGKKLHVNQAVYFDIPKDKRMVFAIPRGKVVYVGTTDTFYSSDIDSPDCTLEDAQYLVDAVNYMFPRVNLQIEDIESSWSGLRPLIHEEGKSPSELSRKDEIFISESGLISIAGGKLTGFRKMAERAVDVAFSQLSKETGIKFVKSTTHKLVVSGGSLNGASDISHFMQDLISRFNSVDQDIIIGLFYKYGSNTEKILNLAKTIVSSQAILEAEILYCIENEMVQNISDFIIRRSGMLYFDRPALKNVYEDIHEFIGEKLEIDELRQKQNLQRFEIEYKSVVAFKN